MVTHAGRHRRAAPADVVAARRLLPGRQRAADPDERNECYAYKAAAALPDKLLACARITAPSAVRVAST